MNTLLKTFKSLGRKPHASGGSNGSNDSAYNTDAEDEWGTEGSLSDVSTMSPITKTPELHTQRNRKTKKRQPSTVHSRLLNGHSISGFAINDVVNGDSTYDDRRESGFSSNSNLSTEAVNNTRTSEAVQTDDEEEISPPQCQKLKVCNRESKMCDGMLQAACANKITDLPFISKHPCYYVTFDGRREDDKTTHYWSFCEILDKTGQKIKGIKLMMKDPYCPEDNNGGDSGEREELPPEGKEPPAEEEKVPAEEQPMEEFLIKDEDRLAEDEDEKRCDDKEPVKYTYRLVLWKLGGTTIAAIHEDDVPNMKTFDPDGSQDLWGFDRYDDQLFSLSESKVEISRTDRLYLAVDDSSKTAKATMLKGANPKYFSVDPRIKLTLLPVY